MNNRFVFVAPMYNASDTLAQMLHSICGQSYKNWKLVLVDDVSTREHTEKTKKIIDGF
jgi:glycosyltransferase involved in cell wall biosynthesis